VGAPSTGQASGVSVSSGSATAGGVAGGQGVRVLVDEGLSGAMVFSPIGAAFAGIATLTALAAWSSSGNRGLNLVSLTEQPLRGRMAE
jgi:hypothetical protein